jgi:hypothetical protein
MKHDSIGSEAKTLMYFDEDSTETIRQIKDLWDRGALDEVVEKSVNENLNFFMFAQIIRDVRNYGRASQKAQNISWAMHEIKSTKPSAKFLFNDEVLPGNTKKVVSICASEDGRIIAYAVLAAVHLGESIQDRMTPENFNRTVGQATAPKPISQMINIVSPETKPWSVEVGIMGLDIEGRPLRIIGVTSEKLYILFDVNSAKELCSIPISGGNLGEHHATIVFPNECFFMDLSRNRIFFIDSKKETLEEICSDGQPVRSDKLVLPEGIGIDRLKSIAVSGDGKYVVLLLENHKESGSIVFGLAERETTENDEPRGALPTKWFKKKDLPITSNLSIVKSGPCFDELGKIKNDGAFYLADDQGDLFTIDIVSLKNNSCPLDELDGMEIVKRFDSATAPSKSPFTRMATAKTLPLVLTSCMKTNSISIWDSAKGTKLLDIACPYHIDELVLAYDDRILITISRSQNSTVGKLAVTFLDYIFLCGKPPRLLGAEDYPAIERLKAFAPDDDHVSALEGLTEYFFERRSVENARQRNEDSPDKTK